MRKSSLSSNSNNNFSLRVLLGILLETPFNAVILVRETEISRTFRVSWSDSSSPITLNKTLLSIHPLSPQRSWKTSFHSGQWIVANSTFIMWSAREASERFGRWTLRSLKKSTQWRKCQSPSKQRKQAPADTLILIHLSIPEPHRIITKRSVNSVMSER